MQVPCELWPIVCRLATSRAWPPRGDTDITAFFNFANRQGLFPLLMADADLPSEVSTAKSLFRALETLYRKRYEMSRNAVLELQRVVGVGTFLFLKGSDYRHRLYERPELRAMRDIDVYMPSVEEPTALQRLAAAGYNRKFSQYTFYFPGHHEILFEIRGVHIEIHRSYSQRVRAKIDYDGMWKRREWFEHDGVSGYRLSSADAILGHAFNPFTVDEFSNELNRYVDFYLLLRRHEDELRLCVARAKAWGIERPLFGALHVTSTLFPSARTVAVTEAMELLLDAPTRRFLVERVLPDPAIEPSGNVLGRRLQLWRKFLLMDSHWRRVAFVAYHAYETVGARLFEWRASRNGFFMQRRSPKK
jgi:hypothetical protein